MSLLRWHHDAASDSRILYRDGTAVAAVDEIRDGYSVDLYDRLPLSGRRRLSVEPTLGLALARAVEAVA